MQIRKHQSGMTMWGMLFVLGTLAFFLFILFKLIPPYLDDFKIKSALDSLGKQPEAGTMAPGEIQEAIRKRLEIDSFDSFDLSHSLTIQPRGKMRVIRINYETVVPMVSNISVLLDFDHSVEVRGAE
ncbi:MAG TPA: DUF4845 domain-containing protein [Candidatus Methylomirabilis sp.]|nr:DUF4845 domain-containing protein [Candidatus Methylomirabilis sp.]